VRTEIEFSADGTQLRGWLYVPDGGAGPFPTIILIQEFGMVKEQYLPRLAELFAASGLASLVYDHRCFGASDGLPRQDIDPIAQARDVRDAISFLETRDEVDSTRIGLWGHSIAGGEALWVAAVDRRVKAVVAASPVISAFRNFRRGLPDGMFEALRIQLSAERTARASGASPAMLKVTCAEPDPAEPHAFPDPRTYYYTHVAAPAERYRNECTLRSLGFLLEFDATPCLPLISPTPLLMMVASTDTATPNDEQTAGFATAREPREFRMLPGDHYDAHLADFEIASAAARDFYLARLGS
jgi:fermentation-respiration switch protein FrsA (DUF1100 family)